MFKRFIKDKKGLTLIELICAVGILSIIAATIGGAMVVATNSYRQGTVESSLQQESQFTANSIEALIVDATDEVDFTGNTLKIKNTDYTYVITYNSADGTLRYTQYDTNDATAILADNELLAEHVESFTADTSDFESNRTVRLAIKLKNQKSEFTTTYNITSRNNPHAGEPVTVTASILCLDAVTLEPNEVYTLPVSVVGPANTNYTCYIEPEPDGTTFASAVSTSSGIEISIGNAEDGGADGLLHLWIKTSASDASGNPLKTKVVNVNIRRVNEVNIAEDSVVGDASKQNCKYTLSVPDANYVGTNLDKVVAAPYDFNYVNPRTLVWSFEASAGSPSDYFDVTTTDMRAPQVQFKLKKDVPEGVTLVVKATSLHSIGTDAVLGTTNKTGLPYDNPVVGIYEITRDEDSDFFRGVENYRPLPDKLRPDKVVPDFDTYYGGNFLMRYFSLDDPSHTSQNYPYWKQIETGTQNGNATEFKMNASDFQDMYFMETYKIQIIYSFRYKSSATGAETYYPAGSNNPNTFVADEHADYFLEYTVKPMNLVFDIINENGTNYSLGSLLNGDKNGVGTASNPLIVRRGSSVKLRVDLKAACAARGEGENLVNNCSKYRMNGSQFVPTGFENPQVTGKQYNDRGAFNEFWIELRTQNGYNTGDTYAIVLNQFQGKGTEYYAGAGYVPDGSAHKGVIYFKIVN